MSDVHDSVCIFFGGTKSLKLKENHSFALYEHNVSYNATKYLFKIELAPNANMSHVHVSVCIFFGGTKSLQLEENRI